ncbi:MAG: hypothetical protein V3U84_03390 [Thiotrichaceae bacterium]
MQNSKMSLCTWFWGVFLVTSLTPGLSALQFQQILGIKRYETAFNMLHKLRAAMVRPEHDAIGSEWPVEVDVDIYWWRSNTRRRAWAASQNACCQCSGGASAKEGTTASSFN